MITLGSGKILECSSRGDKRFSAFYARIKRRNDRSIEESYMLPVPQILLRKMINGRFGRLIVTKLHGRNSYGHIIWECLCDCGVITLSSTFLLSSGSKRSCGCLRREISSSIRLKHGMTGHRLHDIWSGMKSRCNNPDDKLFPYYGGRGIKVCSEWETDFKTFYTWAVSHGYSDHLSLDRYPDNNGNYEPGNCRWATTYEQIQNSRLAKLDKDQVRAIRQDSRPRKEIAESYGVCRSNIDKIKRGSTWTNLN